MSDSFLILNCYPKESRANFDAADIGHPHRFFERVLRRERPDAAVETVFAADAESALPTGEALSRFSGVLWTGSDLTAYHADDARVVRMIDYARTVFDAKVPQWGSCWGLQIAVTAAGGRVAKCPKGRECAFARGVTLTEAGRRSPLYAGKPERFDAYIMHLDEVVELPPGAEILATNGHTKVQALIVERAGGRFWATQYHPEYDLFEMARLVAGRAEPLVKEGFFDTEAAVASRVDAMKRLYAAPDNASLREALSVGDDLLDRSIVERELVNWLASLT